MKEEEVIELIKKGDKELYEILVRKYNQRLYRIARAILKNDSEAEDILQDTYLKAFENLKQFQNKSQFSTWIVRILINNANASLNKRKRISNPLSVENISESENTTSQTPEMQMSNNELKGILESAIDELSDNLRCVYVMREVEGLNVEETSECLGISEENVKTRLHRAKAFLKEELYKKTKGDIEIFRFGLERCDKVTLAVMLQIGKLN